MADIDIDPAEDIVGDAHALNGGGRKDPPKPPPPLVVVDPRSFQGLPIPQRQWIVPDWVPCGVATALYGAGGVGKSLLALQLMTAAAVGRPWVGVPLPGPVRSLGVFCEDDQDELQRRQAAINRELYGSDFDALGLMRWVPRLGEQNAMMTFEKGVGELTAFTKQIEEEAKASGAKLVVIDTLADVFAGNQNDAGQVRQFVQFGLARLARAIGGAVLALAHPSRAGFNSGTGESGSVQWDAAFRSRLYLSEPKAEDGGVADPDARVLTRKKANYAARDETIELRWHDGVLGAGASEGERPDAATVFLRLFDKMTGEGQTLSPNSRAGNYAPRLLVSRSERNGYRRADFERAMQALLNMGEIEIQDCGRPSHRAQCIVRREVAAAYQTTTELK